MADHIYTEDDLATIKRMWLEDNASASQIARYLGGGLTRNAIIGKCQRMGWLKSPADTASNHRRSMHRLLGPREPRPTRQPMVEPGTTKAQAMALPPTAPPQAFWGCLYIRDEATGDFQCCGRPPSKLHPSWCDKHLKVVFQEPVKRTSRNPPGNPNWRRARLQASMDGPLGMYERYDDNGSQDPKAGHAERPVQGD